MRTNIDLDEFLPTMDAPEKVYQLFDSLGYSVLDSHLKTNPSVYNLPVKEAALVEKIFAVSNYDRRFQILLFKLKAEGPEQSRREAIRTIPEKILREVDFPFIIFTPDFKTYTFTLVEKVREGPGEFKRKLTRLSVDCNNSYYTDKEVISNFFLQDDIKAPKEIYKIIQDAMSVERVTAKFFKEYKEVFFALKTNFAIQANDTRMAHDFTQQLMNRIMFLYFIAKKRWVGEDINFLKKFWNSYQEKKQTKNTFYTEWLSVLFFEAFNNKFFPKSYFSKELNSTLQLSPYLNGGLFTEQRLDNIGVKVTDDDFLRIYNFFNRYNFTIREDLPLEEEVAVDPEMIGKVYESLVNLTEASDERGDAGIFYTPRAEIDFMCRLSLVEYLDHHLAPTPSKDYIYKLVFAKTEDELKEAIDHLKITAVWPNLFEDSLDNLTVVDPAVGSGSFLVGMLNVLTELYKLVYKDIGRTTDDFEIKKQIIGRSLYGVDVMDWAVHVCELRLWLQLVVEADIPLAERKTSPLLPNLTFKIRPGDSLVEEVGGVNLSMRDRGALNSVIKRKITMLKQAKYDYFYNNRSSKFYQSEEMLKQEEQLIFQMIIDEKVMQIKNEIFNLENRRKQENLALPGMEIKTDKEQKDLFEEQNKREAGVKQSEIGLLTEIRKNIKTKKPFVWDIDFVEIFADENETGFDIVIGNPPYVRQEKIADPKFPKEKITTENKKEYKEKLTKSVEAHFPWVKNLDKKSDLYIYFFFHGLSLLNPTGTLCFITSNSWLDVGYGKDLQEFLLERVPIKAIFDNQAKRSFASADVNTVITLLGSPSKQEHAYSDNRVKFVMFRKSFEEVVTAKNLITIDGTQMLKSDEEYRVFPATQYELMRDGWSYPDLVAESQREMFNFSLGSYSGNKWGGKFLRAPDIYWKILANSDNKLISLNKVAKEIKPGIYTGINDFFYLNKVTVDKFGVEPEFLKKIIRNTADVNKFFIDSSRLEHYVFDCQLSKDDLKKLRKTGALAYISWGEQQVTRKRQKVDAGIPWPEVETVKKRKPGWWAIPTQTLVASNNFVQYVYNDRFLQPYSDIDLASDRCYHRVICGSEINEQSLSISLNSIITILSISIGRSGLGEGAIKFETTDTKKLLIFDPRLIKPSSLKEFKAGKNIFDECGINPKKDIRSQTPNPIEVRKFIDGNIFEALGLTQDDRKEAYWAVCELVRNRLKKAKSL